MGKDVFQEAHEKLMQGKKGELKELDMDIIKKEKSLLLLKRKK